MSIKDIPDDQLSEKFMAEKGKVAAQTDDGDGKGEVAAQTGDGDGEEKTEEKISDLGDDDGDGKTKEKA